MNVTNKRYLYLITHDVEFSGLCAMEMKHIFGRTSNSRYHLTNDNISISRSPFLKGVVEILYASSKIEQIENQMINDDLHFDNYKIHFVKFDKVPYKERLESMRMLGYTITGEFAIKNPDVEFILTKIDGVWIYGLYSQNQNTWLDRRKKPFNYSNALDVKLAMAVVNIAIENDFTKRVIDPCCGIGTILIEGRIAGIDITGYEMNPLVKQKCNKNLQYFGFDGDVEKINMLNTIAHFDTAILDLPYGQFSFVTKEEQVALIKKTREISDRSIIITMENMKHVIEDCGLKIVESCTIKKSNAFSRYIFICES